MSENRLIARTAALLVAFLVGLAVLGGARVSYSAAKEGGRLVFAARQDIDTLDPHITNRAATRKILLQFVDTLVVINPQRQAITPWLAESWDVSPDGKTYTFHLRRDVRFHDGTPFDAEAVKFTFDRTQQPLGAPGVARSFLGPYAGATVVDSRTLRVALKEPYAPFLRMLALAPLGPISPAAVNKMGDQFALRPVATGPFMVKEWVNKDHVTLVRNPAYRWANGLARHRGPAYLDEIVWRFVTEASTRTAILRTGEAQVSEDLSYADVAGLEQRRDIRILRGTPAGTPWTIFPNVTRFPTNDLAVRRALLYAINRDAIVRVVFHGQSKPAWGLLQPTTPGYAPVVRDLYPYDPAKARKTLDDAGWRPGSDGIRTKDGKRLQMLWIFGTDNGYEEMTPLVQAMARDVGIDMELREAPRAQMYEAWRRNEDNIGELNWWFPDPSILTANFATSRLFAFNPPRLSDPEIDRLLDQAAAMTDEHKRTALYGTIQRKLMEIGAAIPLVDQVTIVGVRREVTDYGFNVVTFPVLYDVYLAK